MSQLAFFNLPDVGEGLTEAEIVTWKVKPGDTVKVNQIIANNNTAENFTRSVNAPIINATVIAAKAP